MSEHESESPREKKLETAVRVPERSEELQQAAKQDVTRVEELDALYRPLLEAGQAELERTESGRKVLEESRALGEEIADLYRSTDRGEASSEEVQWTVKRRLEEFRERHEESLVAAHAPHARLQPSVEVVAQILHPEASKTTWVSETSPFRAMLLEPKQTETPDELGTVSRGLGDPPPPPFHACIRQPYTRREDYPLAPILGTATADSFLDGRLFIEGIAVSAFGLPEAAIATAWVGHDFAVPDGFHVYRATIDYDWRFGGHAWAVLGVSVVNMDAAVLIDNRDGTFTKSAESVCTMIVPFAAGDIFNRGGNAKVTVPFLRANNAAGVVRVMVGADGHGFAQAGLGGGAGFGGTILPSVVVNEICISSTF